MPLNVIAAISAHVAASAYCLSFLTKLFVFFTFEWGLSRLVNLLRELLLNQSLLNTVIQSNFYFLPVLLTISFAVMYFVESGFVEKCI